MKQEMKKSIRVSYLFMRVMSCTSQNFGIVIREMLTKYVVHVSIPKVDVMY